MRRFATGIALVTIDDCFLVEVETLMIINAKGWWCTRYNIIIGSCAIVNIAIRYGVKELAIDPVAALVVEFHVRYVH